MNQSNVDEILLYNSWLKYIEIKKKEFLDNIHLKNILNKSPDNDKFKLIIKNIMNINLFDLSRIMYMGLSFLDKFIKLNIFNVINKYTNCYGDFDLSDISYTKQDKIIETYLEILSDFTLQIEFILNYHFLLLIYHLKKYTNIMLKNTTSNKYQSINQSDFIYKYTRIINELESNVQLSSIMLLFLQLIVNVSNSFENYYSSNETFKHIGNMDNYNNIKKQFDLSKEQYKINKLLDNFIICIINTTSSNTTTSNTTASASNGDSNCNVDDKNMSFFDLCINYIIDLMVICYKKFEKVFDLFIIDVLNKKFPDKNFTVIQTTFKFFLEQEIITVIEKLEKLLFNY